MNSMRPYPPFTDGKVEAQEGEAAHARSRSQVVVEPGFESKAAHSLRLFPHSPRKMCMRPSQPSGVLSPGTFRTFWLISHQR